MEKNTKLELWQRRLADSNRAYGVEVAKMDERERLYNGDHTLTPLVPAEARAGEKRKTSHVRNIVFENIESQISSSIPQPKVTPRRRQDEHLADIIEHFLRNELDRLPFEAINDLAERTVPVQGGVGFLIEWDNSKRTHNTVGEVGMSVIHPKQLAPQPGVYTGIEDMDWIILKIPTTRGAIKRKYDISVELEGESEPEVRSVDGGETAEDALTQYIGYEITADGINRYSWVNDIELENLENYQARRQPICKACGHVRPLPGQIVDASFGPFAAPAGTGNREAALPYPIAAGGRSAEELLAGQSLTARLAEQPLAEIPLKIGEKPKPQTYEGGPCPWCGATDWTSTEQEYEAVMVPMQTRSGVTIPGMQPGIDEEGNAVMKPTLIPFYKPNLYPIVLQRSVSVYGQLLGNSDVDVIRDQQNTINRMEQKIIDRLIKAGTRITLPDKANLRTDPEDAERWFIGNPADKAMIGVYEFKGDLQYELLYLANIYEEARQLLGITDSFQGRRDTTATSGKAKEFSAAQAAGRLESKRVMKNAAYAQIFELMFKFWLAYSDEPRPVSYLNYRGETEYEEFDRYDFLEQDADGNYWWNDQFLFSCDTSAPLESNREAMWQETRLNLQTGAFGDPAQTETLLLFWSKMEELHYPGAASTKAFLEEKQAQEQQMAMQQQQLAAQAQMAQAQQAAARQAAQPQVNTSQLLGSIDQRAKQDAAAAVFGQR